MSVPTILTIDLRSSDGWRGLQTNSFIDTREECQMPQLEAKAAGEIAAPVIMLPAQHIEGTGRKRGQCCPWRIPAYAAIGV